MTQRITLYGGIVLTIAAVFLVPGLITCCPGVVPDVHARGVSLRTIGTALKVYAFQHEGEYPPNLDTLVAKEYIVDGSYLTSPATDNRFHYITGLRSTMGPDTVIAFDDLHEHTGDPDGLGCNVLLVSGESVWFDEPKARVLLERHMPDHPVE